MSDALRALRYTLIGVPIACCHNYWLIGRSLPALASEGTIFPSKFFILPIFYSGSRAFWVMENGFAISF